MSLFRDRGKIRPMDLFEERLRAGRSLAETLAGLSETEAAKRASAEGLAAEVVGPEVEAVTMDLVPNRIRLFADQEGVVRRATAG
jgi:hypothetical protein